MHPHLNEVYPYPRTRQPQLREAYSDAGGYVYTGGGVLRVWGTCRCVATSTSEVSGSVGRLSAGFQQPAVRLHLRVRGEGDIVGNYATGRPSFVSPPAAPRPARVSAVVSASRQAG